MRIQVYTVNAFAKTKNGGNAAGVVFDADKLSEKQMLEIAKKVGFSETAFVMKSKVADFRVRFFTPSDEVDLCGHATIGTFSTMFQLEKIKSGNYKQETKAGVLDIVIEEDGNILMNQSLPKFYEKIDKAEIAKSLNIDEKHFMVDCPIQVVSTGLRDIFIPVKSLDILNSIKPNESLITEISKKHEVSGYHVFTLQTLNGSTAHARNFAPLYDIPEESATGTSTGALSCYLLKHNIITEEIAKNLSFEQGYSMGMPSEILASLKTECEKITEVCVGGIALGLDEIEIEVDN